MDTAASVQALSTKTSLLGFSFLESVLGRHKKRFRCVELGGGRHVQEAGPADRCAWVVLHDVIWEHVCAQERSHASITLPCWEPLT